MKVFIQSLGLLSLCVLAGCDIDDVFDCEKGSRAYVTQTFNLEYFNKIRLEIPATVHLTQGDFSAVTVEGKEDLVRLLELDVHGDEWDIEFDRCVRNMGDFDIYITMPDLHRIIVESSGDVLAESFFEVEELDLLIRGSGMIDIGVHTDILDSHISGSGSVYLEGSAEYHDVRINGSGDVLAFDLPSMQADIESSASGDVQVTVEEYLKAELKGSGDVYYKGNPALNVSTSGSGRIFNAN
jgi:hypothetical protein